MMMKTQSNNLILMMNNLSRTLQDRNSLLKLRNSLLDCRNKMYKKDTPLSNIPGAISKGKFFNMAKNKYIVPEVVDKLPHELDGGKLYIMDCSDSEGDSWQKKYKDGRYFQHEYI